MCHAIFIQSGQSTSENSSPLLNINSQQPHPTDIPIPTFPNKTAAQNSMDVITLTFTELSELRENDPFMFYSILSANNAALDGWNVHSSLLDAPVRASTSSFVDTDKITSEGIVVRQSRLSTECHPCLLFEQMLPDQDLMSYLKKSEQDASFSFDDDYYFYEFLSYPESIQSK